jgi:hypothetical protein
LKSGESTGSLKKRQVAIKIEDEGSEYWRRIMKTASPLTSPSPFTSDKKTYSRLA